MKIGIIGTGMVGSNIAFLLAMFEVAERLVLIDYDKERAIAEAMDITHATPFFSGTQVMVGDYQDLSGAELVIVTAGANQKEGETRLDLLNKNVEIFKGIIPSVARYAPEAILLIATNPVDVMTEVALRLSKFDKKKVLGTGTVLDSSRFRSILGEHLKISPMSIHANVIGEHGDSEVLLWSGALAGTTQVEDIAKQSGIDLCQDIKDKIDHGVRNAAYQIIKGKGATYFGIAASVLHIVNAIKGDAHAILNVSSHHEGQKTEDGGVCYAMPTVIGKHGVETVFMPKLNENEAKALKNSVATLLEYTKRAIDIL